jgi:hypothetical protein
MVGVVTEYLFNLPSGLARTVGHGEPILKFLVGVGMLLVLNEQVSQGPHRKIFFLNPMKKRQHIELIERIRRIKTA